MLTSTKSPAASNGDGAIHTHSQKGGSSIAESAYERIISRLEDAGKIVQNSGQNRAVAQCPAHADTSPSLSLRNTATRALIYCFAGCADVDVLGALGLAVRDLFNEPSTRYQYDDRAVFRSYDNDGKRRFKQSVKDNDAGPQLYRREAVQQAVRAGEMVWLVEGEEDVHALEAEGVTATTAPQGASNFAKVDTGPLIGATVIAVPDRDQAGKRWATDVSAKLAGVAASAEFRIPATGKDASDHLAACRGLDELQPVDPPESTADDPAPEPELPPGVVTPLDWAELFADTTEQEFTLYPLIPDRRHVAIYSQAKVGKSLLMLEIAVAIAQGKPVLGEPTRQQRVLYVDFENDPRGDIRTRLEDMGHGPDDLADLVYLSYPNLAALNSEIGGEQLLANVSYYGIGLVVIDTVSRAIIGEENSNDTWLGLYTHTGLRLKQAGVGMVRLDHSGKDSTRGQRGGSAKTGDVDAVWSLALGGAANPDVVFLDCQYRRFQLPPDDASIPLWRRDDPLRHEIVPGSGSGHDPKVEAVVDDLDRLEIPTDWGRDRVRKALKDAGRKHGNSAISKAVKQRKNLSGTGHSAETSKTCPESSGQVTNSTPKNLSGTGMGQVGTGYAGGPVPALRSPERDRSDIPEQTPPQNTSNQKCGVCGDSLNGPALTRRCEDNHQRRTP